MEFPIQNMLTGHTQASSLSISYSLYFAHHSFYLSYRDYRVTTQCPNKSTFTLENKLGWRPWSRSGAIRPWARPGTSLSRLPASYRHVRRLKPPPAWLLRALVSGQERLQWTLLHSFPNPSCTAGSQGTHTLNSFRSSSKANTNNLVFLFARVYITNIEKKEEHRETAGSWKGLAEE